MKRFLLSTIAVFLFSALYVSAQEKKDVIIETNNAALYKVQNAQLITEIIKTDKGVFEEILQLSFVLPQNFESVLPQTGVTLTAYNEKGKVLGQHRWCSADKGEISKFSNDYLQVILGANPMLEGASKYNLALFNSTETLIPFEQCIDAANDVCGRGKVGSVNWTENGSCSFTCK